MKNFPVSRQHPRQSFSWLTAGIKQAPGEVYRLLDLPDDHHTEAINHTARDVVQQEWDDHFLVDPLQTGAGTSHHKDILEVTAKRATQVIDGTAGDYLIHSNDHTSPTQSTNDMFLSRISSGILQRLDELLGSV